MATEGSLGERCSIHFEQVMVDRPPCGRVDALNRVSTTMRAAPVDIRYKSAASDAKKPPAEQGSVGEGGLELRETGFRPVHICP
jgi:hypothetical protein